MRLSRRALTVIALGAGAAVVVAGVAAAAPSPFGIATPDTPAGYGFCGPLDPVCQWIAMRQAEFYRGLTDALGEARASGAAPWLLLGLSFLYGVFHAAGPGHGKAVISAYLLASGDTARRGVVLSFAAAFVQAVSAIVLVGIAAILLRATALTMTRATEWLEIASYAAIALIGAWLVWSKSFGGHHHHHHMPLPAAAGGAPVDAHVHHHHGHDDHHHHDHHDHGHHHGHHHHAPAPAAAAAAGSPLLQAWWAILAVGIRPCSGAIIVLVFALSQGMFATGVAATFVMALGTGLTVAALAALAVSAKGLAVRLAGDGSGRGATLLRGVEIAAGVVVMLFGLLLLGGALEGGFPG